LGAVVGLGGLDAVEDWYPKGYDLDRVSRRIAGVSDVRRHMEIYGGGSVIGGTHHKGRIGGGISRKNQRGKWICEEIRLNINRSWNVSGGTKVSPTMAVAVVIVAVMFVIMSFEDGRLNTVEEGDRKVNNAVSDTISGQGSMTVLVSSLFRVVLVFMSIRPLLNLQNPRKLSVTKREAILRKYNLPIAQHNDCPQRPWKLRIACPTSPDALSHACPLSAMVWIDDDADRGCALSEFYAR